MRHPLGFNKLFLSFHPLPKKNIDFEIQTDMSDTNNTREGDRNGSSKHQPQEAHMSLKLIDSCLRLSVIPLSVATIWLTVTIHQSNPDYGNLDYNSIMGLKYKLVNFFRF